MTYRSLMAQAKRWLRRQPAPKVSKALLDEVKANWDSTMGGALFPPQYFTMYDGAKPVGQRFTHGPAASPLTIEDLREGDCSHD